MDSSDKGDNLTPEKLEKGETEHSEIKGTNETCPEKAMLDASLNSRVKQKSKSCLEIKPKRSGDNVGQESDETLKVCSNVKDAVSAADKSKKNEKHSSTVIMPDNRKESFNKSDQITINEENTISKESNSAKYDIRASDGESDGSKIENPTDSGNFEIYDSCKDETKIVKLSEKELTDKKEPPKDEETKENLSKCKLPLDTPNSLPVKRKSQQVDDEIKRNRSIDNVRIEAWTGEVITNSSNVQDSALYIGPSEKSETYWTCTMVSSENTTEGDIEQDTAINKTDQTETCPEKELMLDTLVKSPVKRKSESSVEIKPKRSTDDVGVESAENVTELSPDIPTEDVFVVTYDESKLKRMVENTLTEEGRDVKKMDQAELDRSMNALKSILRKNPRLYIDYPENDEPAAVEIVHERTVQEMLENNERSLKPEELEDRPIETLPLVRNPNECTDSTTAENKPDMMLSNWIGHRASTSKTEPNIDPEGNKIQIIDSYPRIVSRCSEDIVHEEYENPNILLNDILKEKGQSSEDKLSETSASCSENKTSSFMETNLIEVIKNESESPNRSLKKIKKVDVESINTLKSDFHKINESIPPSTFEAKPQYEGLAARVIYTATQTPTSQDRQSQPSAIPPNTCSSLFNQFECDGSETENITNSENVEISDSSKEVTNIENLSEKDEVETLSKSKKIPLDTSTSSPVKRKSQQIVKDEIKRKRSESANIAQIEAKTDKIVTDSLNEQSSLIIGPSEKSETHLESTVVSSDNTTGYIEQDTAINKSDQTETCPEKELMLDTQVKSSVKRKSESSVEIKPERSTDDLGEESAQNVTELGPDIPTKDVFEIVYDESKLNRMVENTVTEEGRDLNKMDQTEFDRHKKALKSILRKNPSLYIDYPEDEGPAADEIVHERSIQEMLENSARSLKPADLEDRPIETLPLVRNPIECTYSTPPENQPDAMLSINWIGHQPSTSKVEPNIDPEGNKIQIIDSYPRIVSRCSEDIVHEEYENPNILLNDILKEKGQSSEDELSETSASASESKTSSFMETNLIDVIKDEPESLKKIKIVDVESINTLKSDIQKIKESKPASTLEAKPQYEGLAARVISTATQPLTSQYSQSRAPSKPQSTCSSLFNLFESDGSKTESITNSENLEISDSYKVGTNIENVSVKDEEIEETLSKCKKIPLDTSTSSPVKRKSQEIVKDEIKRIRNTNIVGIEAKTDEIVTYSLNEQNALNIDPSEKSETHLASTVVSSDNTTGDIEHHTAVNKTDQTETGPEKELMLDTLVKSPVKRKSESSAEIKPKRSTNDVGEESTENVTELGPDIPAEDVFEVTNDESELKKMVENTVKEGRD